MIDQNVKSYKVLIVAVPRRIEHYVRAFQGDNDRKFPFSVQAISSQSVAKELFEQINFDLVVLEELRTEGTGFARFNELQFLAWMKEEQPKTMALILTSDENIGDREKAFELGTFDWIVTKKRGDVSADWLIRRAKDALLYRRYFEDLFELKKKMDTEVLATPRLRSVQAEATVVDVLDGHVHEIEGDVVYAKYQINGQEHKAAFDIDLFQKAGADFQGAQVQFLTIKNSDEFTPYDLRIELKNPPIFNKITRDVQEKLDRLEQFDNFEGITQ